MNLRSFLRLFNAVVPSEMDLTRLLLSTNHISVIPLAAMMCFEFYGLGDFSRLFSMMMTNRIVIPDRFSFCLAQVETSLRGELLPRPAQVEHGQCREGFAAGWRCSDFTSFLAGTWAQHWPEECSCYCEDVANERIFLFV